MGHGVTQKHDARPRSAGDAFERTHDSILERVQGSLPENLVRSHLQEKARSLSLQFMSDKMPESFNRMFGQIKGKPHVRMCVRTHTLLTSTFHTERPVMPSVIGRSDFCEVDAHDENGESTVHWCCRSDDLDRLELLIRDGYSLHKTNKKGETPLHVASFAGAVACCQALIAHGVQVNVVDADGWAPLHWAVERNNLECVRELMNHNADINLRLPTERTPLDLAVKSDAEAAQMMELLVKQEQEGSMEHQNVKIVNKALGKFLKFAISKKKVGGKQVGGAHPHQGVCEENDKKWGMGKGTTPDIIRRRPSAGSEVNRRSSSAGEKAPATKHRRTWKHLERQAPGYRYKVHMKRLLNPRIQRNTYNDTEEIKRLIQTESYAAMVYFLRSCDARTLQEVNQKDAGSKMNSVIPKSKDELIAKKKEQEKKKKSRHVHGGSLF